MPRLIYALLASLWVASATAASELPQPDTTAVVREKSTVPGSQQLEHDLQHLPWKQFRSVIEAVPKLQADVEAYGPAGWKFVESKYKTYGWRKGIDKLDDGQKQRLAELIALAKDAK
jgi:hypothetical protein